MHYQFGLFSTLPAIMHAVSAFGTRMCFYKMERETRRVSPKKPRKEDLNMVVDTCPENWWEKDVLTEVGYDALMKVVADAKEQGRLECMWFLCVAVLPLSNPCLLPFSDGIVRLG